MKWFAINLFLLPFISLGQSNPPCDPDAYRPEWIASGDQYAQYGPNERYRVTDFNTAKMKPHLQAALAWIRERAESVTGAREARYYNYFYPGFPNPELLPRDFWYRATGRLSYYYLRVSSNGLFCENGRLGTLNGPATIQVQFNYLDDFASPAIKNDEEGESVPILIKGHAVYKVPEIKRSEARVDYYEFPGPVPEYVVDYSRWQFLNAYVIRNSDKPLFIPITRKDYLEQYLPDMEETYQNQRKLILDYTQVVPPEEIDRQLNERIEEIKRLTEQGAWGYAKENMEQRIRLAQDHYKSIKEEEANKIRNLTAQIDRDYAESVQLIHDYLREQPAADLGKSVPDLFGLGNYEPGYVRKLLAEYLGGSGPRAWGQNTRICRINRDYFDNSLPPDVPQFIAVEFVNLENAHRHLNDIVANINRDYDFSALKALFP